ncbi:hypothetical protein MF672_040950 [Actinomadura sp. ATCC 31491]|uniref:Uncharacterized protein n=1 Tax=Actinomadura luzonensis TaxID=2805427 RepID=A0ABT0G677_9ACTN|nr:hypothetical protein [Actinomadura luzonensis]MCK2220122.1 hypothetical protein [Actinomadura luzonensis]
MQRAAQQRQEGGERRLPPVQPPGGHHGDDGVRGRHAELRPQPAAPGEVAGVLVVGEGRGGVQAEQAMHAVLGGEGGHDQRPQGAPAAGQHVGPGRGQGGGGGEDRQADA